MKFLRASAITLFLLIYSTGVLSVDLRLEYQGKPFDNFFTFPGSPPPDPDLQAISGWFILPAASLTFPQSQDIPGEFFVTDGVNTYTHDTPNVELLFWITPDFQQWAVGVGPIGLSVGDINLSTSNVIFPGGIRVTADQSSVCNKLLPNNTCTGSAANILDSPGQWAVSVAPVSVEIDIKPRRQPNRVNPRSRGLLRVAILGSMDFDALQTDAATLEFGPDAAAALHHIRVRDVNKDDFPDIVVRFKIRDTGIACGDTEATLTGETFAGESFGGTDSLITIGCRNSRPDRYPRSMY